MKTAPIVTLFALLAASAALAFNTNSMGSFELRGGAATKPVLTSPLLVGTHSPHAICVVKATGRYGVLVEGVGGQDAGKWFCRAHGAVGDITMGKQTTVHYPKTGAFVWTAARNGNVPDGSVKNGNTILCRAILPNDGRTHRLGEVKREGDVNKCEVRKMGTTTSDTIKIREFDTIVAQGRA